MEISKLAAASGYSKYERACCLRLLFEQIRSARPAAVPPKEFEELSLEEYFCLLLRDRYGIPLHEISAACATSDGAVLTRLDSARRKAFHRAEALAASTAASPPLRHDCMAAHRTIEEFEPLHPPPPELTAKVGSCTRCIGALARKACSAKRFLALPEAQLPEELALSGGSPAERAAARLPLARRLSAAPWYYRILLEGALASALVMGIVLSVPWIKRGYEFWMERRLDLFSPAEFTQDSTDASSGEAANAPERPETATAPLETRAMTAETEFASKDSDRPASDKIYRVLIKTDSPDTLKHAVISTLGALRSLPATRDGLVSELPGGTMIDAYIPFSSFKPALDQLSRLGETKLIITRSKEKGMSGMARLKIWLQRI